MSMFNDIFCGSKDNEKRMPGQCQNRFSVWKDMEKDYGRLLVLVLKRSGIVSVKTVHKEYGQYG